MYLVVNRMKDKDTHAKYTHKLNEYLRQSNITELPIISEDCVREVSEFMDKEVKRSGPSHRFIWGHDIDKIITENKEYFSTVDLKTIINKYGLLPVKYVMIKHCVDDEYASELQKSIKRKLSREISERQSKQYKQIPTNLMFLKGGSITADVRMFGDDRYIYTGENRKGNTAIGKGEISEKQRKVVSAFFAINENTDFYTTTLVIAIQQFNDIYDLLRYIHEKYPETKTYLTVNYLVDRIDKLRGKILQCLELKDTGEVEIKVFVRENSPYPEHKRQLGKDWVGNTLRCLLAECNAYLEQQEIEEEAMVTIRAEKFERTKTSWVVDDYLRVTDENIDIFLKALNDKVVDNRLQKILHIKRQKRGDKTEITKLILDTIKVVLRHLIEEMKE